MNPDQMYEPKFDRLEPRRKKVAIVGFASSTRLKAPYDDQSWEIWGMNQLYRYIPRLTRWFEMHQHEGPHSYVSDMVPGTDYIRWMRECPVPLYMVSARPDFPTSITYPLDQMLAEFGTDYFHSSVDYMLALAISEGFEEIGVWGIDMAHDTEYEHQKPSGSFWIGVAKGRGIKVTIPPESALLRKAHRYGYEPLPEDAISKQLLQRAQALQERKNELLKEVYAIDGALQENGHWSEFSKHARRGALLVPATT